MSTTKSKPILCSSPKRQGASCIPLWIYAVAENTALTCKYWCAWSSFSYQTWALPDVSVRVLAFKDNGKYIGKLLVTIRSQSLNSNQHSTKSFICINEHTFLCLVLKIISWVRRYSDPCFPVKKLRLRELEASRAQVTQLVSRSMWL